MLAYASNLNLSSTCAHRANDEEVDTRLLRGIASIVTKNADIYYAHMNEEPIDPEGDTLASFLMAKGGTDVAENGITLILQDIKVMAPVDVITCPTYGTGNTFAEIKMSTSRWGDIKRYRRCRNSGAGLFVYYYYSRNEYHPR